VFGLLPIACLQRDLRKGARPRIIRISRGRRTDTTFQCATSGSRLFSYSHCGGPVLTSGEGPKSEILQQCQSRNHIPKMQNALCTLGSPSRAFAPVLRNNLAYLLHWNWLRRLREKSLEIILKGVDFDPSPLLAASMRRRRRHCS